MKPIELDTLQVNQILKQNNPPAPLHTVVDDRRMKPFMSMEDFEKKWQIQVEKEITETSVASQQADKMGLDYMGFGRYGNDNQVTHKSIGGKKLVPVKKGAEENPSPKPEKSKMSAVQGIPDIINGTDAEIIPLEDSFMDTQYIGKIVSKTSKYRYNSGADLITQAEEHKKIIYSDDNVKRAVELWTQNSVWTYPSQIRKNIFDQLDYIINEKETYVNTNQVYRGMKFKWNKDDSDTVRDSFLASLKKGKILHLPPSGFTTSLTIATDFSVFYAKKPGSSHINIIIRMVPQNETKIKGISVWKTTYNHEDEQEIISSSGKYKVDYIRAYPYAADDRFPNAEKSVLLVVDMIQLDDVNENTEETMLDKAIDLLFGDSMRNTSDILQKIPDMKENLEEYSDETKKKKGIPLNAKSGANGWWYVGTKPVGKTIKGKFVPMVKINAAKKKAEMMKKKKIAALKKKKIAMLKKKKALMAKKKKALALKKKKAQIKKLATKLKPTASVEEIQKKLKVNPLIKKMVYDEEARPVTTVAKLTGVSVSQLKKLAKHIEETDPESNDEAGIYVNPDTGYVTFGYRFGKAAIKKKTQPALKPPSASLTPAQQYNHYKKVYDTLKKAMKAGDGGSLRGTMPVLAKKTGIDVDNLTGLYQYFQRNTKYYYDAPIYKSYGQVYTILPYHLSKALPKPKKDITLDILKKIKATEADPIEGSVYSSTLNKYLLKNKIVKKLSFSQIDKEAQVHAKYIKQSKEQIRDAIDDWVSDSVWGNSPQRRKEIFKQITNIMNHYKPRMKKAKQVFRGVTFDPTVKNNAFFKKYLSQFKIGKTIKLPPSGFSVDHTTATSFAVDEQIKILLRAKSSDNKGIKGLSVWQEHTAYKGEREIITSGGNYKVDKVIYHNLPDSGGKFIFIDLTQINKVNEEIEIETDDMETINGIMFGDSMRNTAKNMKKLFSMKGKKKEVTEQSQDTYSIDKNQAKEIYEKLGYTFDFEEFYKGINVELEHSDVTDADLETTAKIAAAHLRENPKYYTLLTKYVEKPNDN